MINLYAVNSITIVSVFGKVASSAFVIDSMLAEVGVNEVTFSFDIWIAVFVICIVDEVVKVEVAVCVETGEVWFCLPILEVEFFSLIGELVMLKVVVRFMVVELDPIKEVEINVLIVVDVTALIGWETKLLLKADIIPLCIQKVLPLLSDAFVQLLFFTMQQLFQLGNQDTALHPVTLLLL